MPSTLIRSTCLMLPDCAAAVVETRHASTSAASTAGRKRRTVTERPPEKNGTELEAYGPHISDRLTVDKWSVKSQGSDGRPRPSAPGIISKVTVRRQGM